MKRRKHRVSHQAVIRQAALLEVVFDGLTIGMADAPPAAPAFELFPVPATERLTIRSAALAANDRLDLYDPTGRLVRSERAAHATTHELDVQGLVPGVYQLRWVSARGVGQRSVIVQ